MITIFIDGFESPLSELSEEQIHGMIGSRQSQGQTVCVRVVINNNDAEIALASDGCGPGGGSSRELRPAEEEIVSFWTQLGLHTGPIDSGNLIAFLKRFQNH